MRRRFQAHDRRPGGAGGAGARYGFTPPGPTDDATRYNWGYRNRVLAQTASERLFFLYANGGLPAVQEELDGLRKRGAF